MSITLPDARQLPDEVLEALRLRAIRGCEMGYTQARVAASLGLARETVSRWWSAYTEGGAEALPGVRTGRPTGPGRTPNDGQAAWLRTIPLGKQPEEVGISSPLWTRRAARESILKEYGIDMPARTVGADLRRWRFTPKAPRRRSRDQDPEGVRRWLKEDYPAIERRAAREGAVILWCDETGVAADHPPRRGYSRRGRPATLEVPDSHIRAGTVAAIGNGGPIHLMTYRAAMNSALFIAPLERLLGEVAGKVFLITDRLPAHDAAAARAWVRDRGDRIERFFLPAYAPERDPEEYLNSDMRGSINATGLPDDREGLRSRVEGFMERLRDLPERVHSYFSHPCVRYAAGL